MSTEPTSDDLTLFAEGSLARTPASPHPTAKDSKGPGPGSTTSSPDSSKNTTDSSTSPAPAGWSSRTRPDSFDPTTVETWPLSSEGWKTSGMGGPTGWWTGDTSEHPSDDRESSWSDIVEETPDPHGRFWVTTDQARKLLPRVESAGDRSDPHLLEMLRTVAEQ